MNPIWKVPWFLPRFVDEQIPGAEVRIEAIIFRLEPAVLLNWDYVDRHDRTDSQKFPYRYRCLSCYAASGDEDGFRTQCEQLQRLTDGPTEKQQSQMADHAKQHSIMYAWAKGLK